MKEKTFKTDTNDSRKLRKSFKKVETDLNHTPDIDDRVLRPRVNRIDDLNRLSDEIKSTPTAIVNFLVDIGLEVLERGTAGMKKELSKKIQKLLKWGYYD